ncbi:MAG: tetratricopeptide repeat-containing serine protease family protein [bacterium]
MKTFRLFFIPFITFFLIIVNLFSQINTTNFDEIRNRYSSAVVVVKVINNLNEEFHGSGIVLDSTGYIVTCNHVIAGSKEIKVIFNDKKEYNVVSFCNDPVNDIALLKINAGELEHVVFNQLGCNKGESICVLSNPGNLRNILAVGTISNFNTSGSIVLDVITARGSSGGAVFTTSGNVIGMIVSGDETRSITNAVPIQKIASLRQKGEFKTLPTTIPFLDCNQLLNEAIDSINSGINSYHSAFNLLSLIMNSCPDNPGAIYWMAYMYYNLGNFTTALSYYNRALENRDALLKIKMLHDAYFERGITLVELDMYRKAIPDFKEAQQIYPVYKNKCYFNIYSCFYNLDQCDSAIFYFFKIPLEEAKNMILVRNTWENVITCLEKTKGANYKERIESIRKIVESLPPLNPDFYLKEALKLYKSGKLQEANDYLLEGISKYPGNYDLNSTLGLMFFEQGIQRDDNNNYNSALRYFNTAYKVNERADLGNNIVTTYYLMAKSHYLSAIDYYNQLVIADNWDDHKEITKFLDSSNSYIRKAMQDRYFNKNNASKSILSLDTNIKLMTAQILRQREKYREALDSLEKYFVDPNKCEILFEFAMNEFKLKQNNNALNYINRAIENGNDSKCLCNIRNLKINILTNSDNNKEALQEAMTLKDLGCKSAGEQMCYTLDNFLVDKFIKKEYDDIIDFFMGNDELLDICPCANWFLSASNYRKGRLEDEKLKTDRNQAVASETNIQNVLEYYKRALTNLSKARSMGCQRKDFCLESAIHNSMGLIIANNGNYIDSRIDYMTAKKFASDRYEQEEPCKGELLETYLHYANLYVSDVVQNYDSCIIVCNEGLNIFPNNCELSYYSAFSYYKLFIRGQSNEDYLLRANQIVNKLLEFCPKHVGALRLGVEINVLMKQYKKACEYCRSLMREGGDNPDVPCLKWLRDNYQIDCPE